MLTREVIEKGYHRESQSYGEKELQTAYKAGVFDWHTYSILINDVVVEKIKARDDESAKAAAYELYNLEHGDYIKIVEVVTTYRTTYENYQD